MPTYEYVCPAGHQFDRFQKISDAAGADCPECGQAATRKISGGAGLVFKGSGFYLTDYGKNAHRKGSEGGGGSSESKSESSGDSKASPKTDTKSETSSASAKSEGAPKSESSKSSESKTSSPKTTGGDSK